MRKNLILIFSFLSLLFSAQQDSFHYILTYESIREMPKKGPYKKGIEKIAINNEDSSYYMYIYPDKTARLFDYQNFFVYHFKINSKTDHLMSNLKMTSSVKMSGLKLAFYSAKKLKENEYLVQVFDDADMKKSTTDITVKIRETPVNLLFINADIGPHSIQLEAKLKELLDPNKTYVVESSRVDYKNGTIFNTKLKDYKKIE